MDAVRLQHPEGKHVALCFAPDMHIFAKTLTCGTVTLDVEASDATDKAKTRSP